MIIFLYGSDSYRRNKKLKELLFEFKKKHEAGDIVEVDLEETPDEWKRVRDFLNQPSMFSEAKAAIMKESGVVDEKEWRALLKSHRETSKSFIFISDRDSPAKPMSFLLEEPVRSQEFAALSGRFLDVFLKKESEERGLLFSPEAWKFLVGYIEAQPDPSWHGVNELEKIALARFHEPIGISDLKRLTAWLSRETVTRLAREILSTSDRKRKLLCLELLFIQKEAPSYAFNSLGFQAQGKTALALADYDISVKSGGLEYEEALLDFILR